ncbi:MAG: TIGR04282 family arsenosugar biosynthesis glycosyltransferase, partial [Pseudomonadota bacterium]
MQVFVFLKAPRAGAVKTRLGAEIGMGRAAAIFRTLTARTIAEAQSPQWALTLATAPIWSANTGWGDLWPRRIARWPQPPGDLGTRMKSAFNNAPTGPVVIIGADAPGMRRRHLRFAFQKLRGADAVFGPAEDGGYWLIGMARRRPAPNLFSGVRWSTEYALEDTVNSLPKGFRVDYLSTLGDIDRKSDL